MAIATPDQRFKHPAYPNGEDIVARRADWRDPRHQASSLLRLAFTVAPIAFGLDKFYDIALRDFGLMLAALTLARLASIYDPPLQLRRR
jgi:hypothetical protein